MSDAKLILRPLIGLMNGQSPQMIEWHLVHEVEKYRRLREEASRLEAQLEAAGDQDSAEDTKRAFVTAMIAVHAQQTVVSTLLDILGYLPDLPGSPRH